MADADPLLGGTKSDMPTLYNTDSSYFSMIVRMALEEKGVKWINREMDIHSRMEQFQPWYVSISPGICVPTLMHKDTAVPESLDILRYVDSAFDTGIALTPAGAGERATMERFIQEAYSFDVEAFTMGYAADWNPIFARLGPKIIGGTIPKLEKMKAERPQLAQVCDRKIAQNKRRIADIFGPPNGLAKGLASFKVALEKLEQQLVTSSGPYICGNQFTLADVVFTNLLCRGNWIAPGRQAIAEKPSVTRYWQEVQKRPAFASARLQPSVPIGKLRGMLLQKLCKCCGCVLALAAPAVAALHFVH